MILDRLLSLARPSVPEARVPAATRVYAVGDIHGRADLLDALLDEVRADADRAGAERKVVVFIGDYVDRGPNSVETITLLFLLKLRYP